MNINQIKMIIRVLDEAQPPILCNNKKLWRLEVERALLLLRNDVENRRLKGSIAYHKHKDKKWQKKNC